MRRRSVFVLLGAVLLNMIGAVLVGATPGSAATSVRSAEHPIPGDFYQIIARHSGHCLTAAYPQGSQVRTEACGTRVAGQTWQVEPVSPGSVYFSISADRTTGDTCLDVEGASTETWARVNHQRCGYQGANRHWRLVKTDGEYFEFIARHSGSCLDIYYGWAIQWPCNNGYNQQFRFRPVPFSKATTVSSAGTRDLTAP